MCIPSCTWIRYTPPPGQVQPPLWAGTPPWPGTPWQVHSRGQVHPPGRYTPWAGTPLPQAGTPRAGTPPSGQVHPLWAGTPHHGSSACWEIRATSGRYASYWNAFLFQNQTCLCKTNVFISVITSTIWR